MSLLQAQVVESLNGLSDENLTFLLDMIAYMKPTKSIKSWQDNNSNAIKIGMFKGEEYIAKDYDLDQDNDEIAKLFEVSL